MAQEVRYLIYYPCCEVAEYAPERSPCWICGLPTGLLYFRASELLPKGKRPARLTNSTQQQFSQVKPEYLKCPHP